MPPAQTTPSPKHPPRYPRQDPRTPTRRHRAHPQLLLSCRVTHAHPQVPPSRHTRLRCPRAPPSPLVRTRWPPFLARAPGRAASTRLGTSERSATGVLRLVALRSSALVRLLLCFDHGDLISRFCKISYTCMHDHLRPHFAPSPCIMSNTYTPLFRYCMTHVLGCRLSLDVVPCCIHNCPSHYTVIDLGVCGTAPAAALMALRSQVPSCRSGTVPHVESDLALSRCGVSCPDPLILLCQWGRPPPPPPHRTFRFCDAAPGQA